MNSTYQILPMFSCFQSVYNGIEEANWCIIFILRVFCQLSNFFKLVAFDYYKLKAIIFIESVCEMQPFGL